MAAVTTRLRFSNAVYVAPARPLLEVAKQVATASVLSDGRVSLAAGVGWMREEYELMGQDFGTRGKRLDEMIPALRELWRGGWVTWSGEHYQVPEMMIEPHPPAPVPDPVRRGVRRRAASGGTPVRRLGRLRVRMGRGRRLRARSCSALRREYGRESEPFDIMLALLGPAVSRPVQAGRGRGITAVMCSPWMGMDVESGGIERYREPIERFAETIIAKVRA